jgi:hypothetical protein
MLHLGQGRFPRHRSCAGGVVDGGSACVDVVAKACAKARQHRHWRDVALDFMRDPRTYRAADWHRSFMID